MASMVSSTLGVVDVRELSKRELMASGCCAVTEAPECERLPHERSTTLPSQVLEGQGSQW